MGSPKGSRDGVDVGGTLANALNFQRGYDGQTFYATDLRQLLVWDYTLRTWTPVDGKMIYSASSPRFFFDDFRAGTLDSRYTTAKGSNGSAAIAATVSGSAKGEINLVTGAAGDTVAHDGSSLTGPGLDFTPNSAAITVQAYAKLAAISNVAAFVGLNDALSTTTLEMPLTLATATVTANATNAVGFLFDTAATTQHWWGVAVNAGGTPQKVDLGVLGGSAGAPAAATYQLLKVTVDASGNANFYIGGTLVGLITGAVAAAATLTPIAVATARTTASQTLTLDLFTAK